MTTAIERQQNLPPHKGDISYGRLIKRTKMLKNMMKFVLFKFSVEWLFTIYEIRKGSKKFYNCVNLLNLYYFTRNGSSFCLIPKSIPARFIS